MWVLEAWKDAEKVWFPVVWETEKDASNVVDYNIHEEITKDASSVINANNDTTTGMATVIPWINAPKLIASTSIIWELTPAPVHTEIRANLTIPINYLSKNAQEQALTTIYIINEWWAWFTEVSGAVTVWKSGIYDIQMNIPSVWSYGDYGKTIKMYVNWVVILNEWSVMSDTEVINYTMWLAQWDELTFSCTLTTVATFWVNWTLTILFTKQ